LGNVNSTFLCDCKEQMRTACSSLPFYREHDGKRYCVFHFPGNNKLTDFNDALQKKLDAEDFDFRGVWFPGEADFASFHFASKADFTGAIFTSWTTFSSARFDKEAEFRMAEFQRQTLFRDAQFLGDGDFFKAKFDDVSDFEKSIFHANADFTDARFVQKANYRNSTFHAFGKFLDATFQSKVYFNNAIFEKRAIFDSSTFIAEVIFDGAELHSDATFAFATFNARAEFSYVVFGGETKFIKTTFAAGVTFVSATFRGELNFSRSTAKGAYFRGAIFEGAVFVGATTFEREIDFVATIFRDSLTFVELGMQTIGEFQSALYIDFQNARIEQHDRVSFRNSVLFPHWFVNVDSRRFEFVNIEWRGTIAEEIAYLSAKGKSHPHRLLALACRQLAVNAEENNRYEEASMFRYWSMDFRRIERYRGLAVWTLDWWYWAASGFGERVGRATTILIGIWLIFAWLYSRVDFVQVASLSTNLAEQSTIELDQRTEPLPFGRALMYSLEVMALQKPNPRPATINAELWVFIETVGGPLQAALLALAIRRKFMRLS